MVVESLETLVRSCVAGESGAIDELCERIIGKIYFRANYLLQDQDEAHDVTQEILIRVIGGIGGLKAPETFPLWLNNITINEVRRHIQKNSMRRNMEQEDIADYADTLEDFDAALMPDFDTDNEEYKARLMDMIRGLPERQREAIMLRYYDDMPVQDIAAAMDVSSQAVSRYMKLARDRLAEGLTGVAVGGMLIPTRTAFSQLMSMSVDASPKLSEADKLQMIGKCKQDAGGGQAAAQASRTAAKSGLAANLLPIALVAVMAIAAIAIIVTNLSGGGIGGAGGAGTGSGAAPVVQDDGSDIAFVSGGQYPFVDPVSAEAVIAGDPAMKAVSWSITASGSDTVIVSGKGSRVNSGFNGLEPGNYRLTYLVADGQGHSMLLSRTFIIK